MDEADKITASIEKGVTVAVAGESGVGKPGKFISGRLVDKEASLNT